MKQIYRHLLCEYSVEQKPTTRHCRAYKTVFIERKTMNAGWIVSICEMLFLSPLAMSVLYLSHLNFATSLWRNSVFYRWRNWDQEKFTHLLNVTFMIDGKGQIKTQIFLTSRTMYALVPDTNPRDSYTLVGGTIHVHRNTSNFIKQWVIYYKSHKNYKTHCCRLEWCEKLLWHDGAWSQCL